MMIRKKIVSVALSLMLITGTVTALPYSASAVFTSEDNYFYDVIKEDNTVEIQGYNGSLKELSVPEEINGMKVAGIGERAFSGKDIISVRLPVSVKYIKTSAFQNCSKLVKVDFSNGIEKIYGSAFLNCTSLTGVEFPDSLKNIGKSAFQGCSMLSSATFPDNISDIAQDAFTNTFWLDNFPTTGIVYAGKFAYTYRGRCPETLIFDEGTLGVSSSFFTSYNSEKLVNIEIPASVNNFKTASLGECSILENINVNSKSNTYYSKDGILYTKNKKNLLAYTRGRTADSFDVPEGVTSISCFHNDNVEKVYLPTTMKTIKKEAFFGCYRLNYVSLNEGLTTIGDSAFENCAYMNTLVLPNTVTSLGARVCYNCEVLTELVLPNGLTEIKDGAFGACARLKTVNISSGLRSIGANAFADCGMLSEVIIPRWTRTIGENAFSNCPALKSVKLTGSINEIGSNAFGYAVNEETYLMEKVPDFLIKCVQGSAAELYASSNGFAFEYFIEPYEPEPVDPEPEPVTPVVKKTSITLKKTSAKLYVKQTTSIKVTVKNKKGTTTFASANKKVAKVDKNGKVTAVKKGTVKITVKNNGVNKVFKVTVINPTLNAKSKTLKKGASFKLKIKGKVGTAKFSTSKKKVATVDKNGKIKAKKKGKAVITVKTNGLTLKCKINVK